MGTTKCKHTFFRKACPSCRELKKKWYSKLEAEGFVDIEYGLESPRFLTHTPDPTAPGAEEAKAYYERVWQVFHGWSSSGRSLRDCRIAELFANQLGTTGTVRGICRQLRNEGLSPWSSEAVQRTLKEIHFIAKSDSPVESMIYVPPRHAAA